MKHALLFTTVFILLSLCSHAQNALNFDGDNDYVSVPNGGGLNNLESGTIELWVKWIGDTQSNGYGFHYGSVLGRQKNNNWNNHLISLNNSNPATAKVIWCPYSHATVALESSSSPGSDTWVHIAITYASGTHKMFINGELEATSTTTGDIDDDDAVHLSIGAWIGHGNCYSRTEIDEVRIWDDLRTPTEIKDNMNRELAGNEENLVTYFNFNQGVAEGDNSGITTLTDVTSNGHNGILYNFALTGTSSNWVSASGINTGLSFRYYEHKYTIYPNPTSDFIYISGLPQTVSFVMYNICGKEILKGTISDNERINVHSIAKGIYLLKIGNTTPVKIIKK